MKNNIIILFVQILIIFFIARNLYASTGEKIYKQSCAACHNSSRSDIPNLFGENKSYLFSTLMDYKNKRRKNEVMNAMVSNLTVAQIKSISNYLSKQEACDLPNKVDPLRGNVRLGNRVTKDCKVCHGYSFRGNRTFDDKMPDVAGQKTQYLINQLMDFKYKKRNTSGAMNLFAQNLEDKDILDAAAYINSLNSCKD